MEELENIEPTESDLNIEKSRSDLLAWDAMEYATQDKTAVALEGESDRISSDDVHNMLMGAGMTPGIGNVADLADAVLYATEGEFGEAALSAAAIIPYVGQFVSAKRALKAAKESGEEMVTLYRGVDKWHSGKMVKEGKFVGGGDVPDLRYKDGLWVSEHKDIAKGIAGVEGGVVLEFEVPKSFMTENFTKALGVTEATVKKTGRFDRGLPKEFLKKVHK